jgi:hypothetical protein
MHFAPWKLPTHELNCKAERRDAGELLPDQDAPAVSSSIIDPLGVELDLPEFDGPKADAGEATIPAHGALDKADDAVQLEHDTTTSRSHKETAHDGLSPLDALVAPLIVQAGESPASTNTRATTTPPTKRPYQRRAARENPPRSSPTPAPTEATRPASTPHARRKRALPELGEPVLIRATVQAISLSEDGREKLIHLLLKANARSVGKVVLSEASLAGVIE